MFDKVKKLNEMRKQAMQIQKQLKKEEIEVVENGVRIVVSGDQEVRVLEVDGGEDQRVKDALNKAIKKSQKTAAKKLQQMGGGLSGLMGGS